MKNHFDAGRTAQMPEIPPARKNLPDSVPLKHSYAYSRQASPALALGVLAIVSAAFLIPGLFASFLSAGSETAWIEQGTQVQNYFESSYPSSRAVTIDQLDPIVVRDNLIVTYQIQKKDPLTQVNFILDVTAAYDGDWDYDWVNSDTIGFETPEVFVSAVFSFDSLSQQQVPNVDLTMEYEDTMVQTPQEYSYLMDEGSDDFLTEYRKMMPERYCELTLDSDGVNSQNGIVTFTVTNPETNFLSGAVNIVYKKNGQVVFGDIYRFSSSTTVESKTFAYTPKCELPEYDEVELINLHA